MKINSLQEIDQLPIATDSSEVGERLEALLDFIVTHDNISKSRIAESIVDIIGYATYMVFMPNDIETKILNWISTTFDQNDENYIDAISTVYANMVSNEALVSLKKNISETTNIKAKELLQEGLSEFELKT